MLICFIVIIFNCFSQDKKNEKSNKDDEQSKEKVSDNTINQKILIEKEKVLKLPIFEKTSSWESLKPIVNQNDIVEKKVKEIDAKVYGWHDNLSAVTMEEIISKEKYFSYVKLGVGNFLSSYLEAAYLNHKYPNTRINYGFRLLHDGSINGPVNDSKSGFNKQSFEGFAETSLKKWNIHLNTKTKRNNYSYYGIYSIPNASGKEVEMNNFYSSRIQGVITYNRSAFSGMSLEIVPTAISYRGKNDSKEDTISLLADGWIDIDNDLRFVLNSQYMFSNLVNNNFIGIYRHFMKFNPLLEFNYGNFEVGTGLNLNISKDNINEKLNTNVMLNLWLRYPFNELTRVYIGINGDTHPRLLTNMMDKVSFLNPVSAPIDKKNIFVSYLGFKTYSIKNLYINSEFKYSFSENHLAYHNNDKRPEYIDALYLGEGHIWTLDLHARYKLTANISFDTRYKYYKYNFNITPYNLPSYELELGSDFDIYEKIFCRVGGYLSGGRQYKSVLTMQENELDYILDIYGKFDYKVSENINVFLHLNNIFNSSYMNYYLYPSKNLFFLIGGTYKW